jgi:hypothetical protein
MRSFPPGIPDVHVAQVAEVPGAELLAELLVTFVRCGDVYSSYGISAILIDHVIFLLLPSSR